MKQNGKKKNQVTHLNARSLFPDYSPDGSRIAFSASGVGGDANTEIFVVNADGSGLQQLVDRQRGRQRLPRLVAGQHEDRLHEHAHRDRAGLGPWERRRLRPDTAHLRPVRARPASRLEPGRLQDRLPRGHGCRERRQNLRHERRRQRPARRQQRPHRSSSEPPGHPTAARSRSSALAPAPASST